MLLVYRFFLEDLRAMDGDCKHFYPVMGGEISSTTERIK